MTTTESLNALESLVRQNGLASVLYDLSLLAAKEAEDATAKGYSQTARDWRHAERRLILLNAAVKV